MKATLVLPALFLFSLFPAKGADIEVIVSGIRSANGEIMVAVYDNAADFRLKELSSVKISATSTGAITAKLTGLQPGVYAIGVVHDLNSNGIMDVAGAFKIPTEPFGFSNNPRIKFGPPRFEQCAFQLNEPGARLTVSLR